MHGIYAHGCFDNLDLDLFIILILYIPVLYYPFWEIWAALPAEAAARVALPSPTRTCWVDVSIIHQTLIWATGSLMCIRDHSYACHAH